MTYQNPITKHLLLYQKKTTEKDVTIEFTMRAMKVRWYIICLGAAFFCRLS